MSLNGVDDRFGKLQSAFDEGNWGEALFLARSLVNDGETELLSLIGFLYDVGGNGVVKDRDEAVKWYRRAVFEADDYKGHTGIATFLFDKALGEKIAWELFEHHALSSLSGGETKSALLIAFALDIGRFGIRDIEKAKNYYQRAAENGFFLARQRLANLRLYSGDLRALPELLKIAIDIRSVAGKNIRDPRLFLLKKNWGAG